MRTNYTLLQTKVIEMHNLFHTEGLKTHAI